MPATAPADAVAAIRPATPAYKTPVPLSKPSRTPTPPPRAPISLPSSSPRRPDAVARSCYRRVAIVVVHVAIGHLRRPLASGRFTVVPYVVYAPPFEPAATTSSGSNSSSTFVHRRASVDSVVVLRSGPSSSLSCAPP